MFSKRHRRALGDGRLQVELGSAARGRIRRLLDRYNSRFRTTDETGWNYESSDLDELADELLDVYGSTGLPGGGLGLSGFYENAPAANLFDAVELFWGRLSDPSAFLRELNDVLCEEDSPWRLLGGEFVLLDNAFARDELATRADTSLQATGFAGALVELRNARGDIVDGDGRGAVHNAGSALESVVKALLGRQDGTGRKLLQDVRRAGYLDALPVALRDRFTREVLEPLVWMRNNLGGHGQGEELVEVSRPYAELAIDLASAYGHFFVSLKLEQEGVGHLNTATATVTASGSPGFDDDIPF